MVALKSVKKKKKAALLWLLALAFVLRLANIWVLHIMQKCFQHWMQQAKVEFSHTISISLEYVD